MSYKIGRALGQAVREAPLLSSVAVVVAVVALVRCIGAESEEDVVARELRHAAEMEATRAEKLAKDTADALARLEAAKSPEQRASESAARAAAEAKRQEREAAAKAKALAWEASVAKAAQGLTSLKWWERCASWGRELRRHRNSAATEAAYRSIKEEGLINYEDEIAVAAKQRLPSVGMTGCGAVAILGADYHGNATTHAYGTRVQMVFRSRGIYVYTEGKAGDHNGTVTSIQY